MNPELGQSLVNARFPRNFHRTAEALINPTLTELVDQCFAQLPGGQFNLERRRGGTWFASITNGLTVMLGDGDTAEDAVAKLWLVLRAE